MYKSIKLRVSNQTTVPQKSSLAFLHSWLVTIEGFNTPENQINNINDLTNSLDSHAD